MKLTYNKAIEILAQWYDFHHGTCDDQTTCTMSEAWQQGYSTLAIDSLLSAIGIDVNNSADEELEREALKAWKFIESKHLKRFKKAVEEETKDLFKTVSHFECECGAVVWQPEFCDHYCSSCGEVKPLKGVMS